MGGGYVGRETCFFLANKVIEVTFVLRSANPALNIKFWKNRTHYWHKLKECGVKVMPQIKCGKITLKGLNLTNKEGTAVFLEADNIILATGATPNKALGKSLKGKYLEFAEIGDCVEPRQTREVIEEGTWDAVLF
jgi:pyruvate/2-oxoglutarate dehydrogenase complex dihydrolipoamide dehydrogenase (E3) component